MSNKHIHWLTPINFLSVEHLEVSNLASIRMRAGVFGRRAKKIGIDFTAGNYVDISASDIVISKIGGDCDNGRSNDWISWIKEAKSQGKNIILDYTDHHLLDSSTPMGNFYNSILSFIDSAVVPSNKMKSLLSEFFTGSIDVIEDPLEIDITPTRKTDISFPPTVLWFGHATNISYLINYLESVDLCDTGFNLMVLSNENGLRRLASYPVRTRMPVQLTLLEWSVQKMVNAAKLCDVCIIPSDLNDLKKNGASANRLTTSLALGLPTMAENLSSYSEFNSYYTDIRSESISRFFIKKKQELAKVDQAQHEILPFFTQEKIADKWIKYFNIHNH